MKWRFSLFPHRYGLFPYMYLIYLLYPIVSLTKENGVKQIIGYGMTLLFFVTYRQLYFVMWQRKYTYWLAVMLAIVFIFSTFYQLTYIFLGFFSATFVGFYHEKQKFYRGLASLAMVELLPILFVISRTKAVITISEFLNFAPFLIIMLLTPFGIRSINRRRELERELDQKNHQIEELVKREERVRIARDLHDTLGHTLSLLTLKSQLVQRLIAADPERARLEAREMEVTSRAALKQVRELVTDMRAATITEELIQVQHILRAAGITYKYEGTSDFSRIPLFTQNIVSMCIREAATNVVKHSRAAHCSLSVHLSKEKINVMVHDDGMGAPMNESNQELGNGLKGMEERLALVDGSLAFSNRNGAVLEINVPIINKQGAAG
ncbi:sensor histidine kinase [Bacillus sp. BRMEA1]|uniref:sensor histidine kinase n=1 Tax=Neobacillus endophyticus TaxID=2738405 RepID=UPI0015673220|nr:sensor histidine kinase [Neobacillus endophyticus]NRD76727.1 sensor histidine kinase [Neobacillus endophyticus]